MHLFKPATRSSGRIPCFLLLSLLFLLVSLYSEAAFSASLTVKIRQLNPDGQVQQVTCAEKQKCVLPIDIQTGSTKDTLTVIIQFVTPTVVVKFQTAKGYLYAGTKWPDGRSHYETLVPRTLTNGKTSTEDVTLYLPAVPTAFITPILDAAHETELKIAHPAVATLEITAQPAP